MTVRDTYLLVIPYNIHGLQIALPACEMHSGRVCSSAVLLQSICRWENAIKS